MDCGTEAGITTPSGNHSSLGGMGYACPNGCKDGACVKGGEIILPNETITPTPTPTPSGVTYQGVLDMLSSCSATILEGSNPSGFSNCNDVCKGQNPVYRCILSISENKQLKFTRVSGCTGSFGIVDANNEKTCICCKAP